MSCPGSRFDSLADTSREGYRLVASFLAQKKALRAQEAENEKKKRPVIKVPCKVSGAGLQRLAAEFPWEVQSVDRNPSGDAFFTAKAYCCSYLNQQLKAWDGDETLAFDLDLMTMAARGWSWSHSCCTLRTPKKAAQFAEQRDALDRAIGGRDLRLAAAASEIKKQSTEGGSNVCLDARRCNRVVDTILLDFIHSPMAAEQTARTMLQHQASRAKVWFFFETAMFTETQGDLTSMDGRFFVDKSADTVFLFSAGKPRAVAEYSYSAMMSFLLQSRFVVDGKEFVLEVHDSLDGVKFVQLTHVEVVGEFESDLDVHHFRPAGQEMLVLEHKWSPSRILTANTMLGRQQFVRTVVPRATVEKVVGRVLTLDFSKISLESCRAAVRDMTNQEFTNGNIVKRGRGLDTETFEQLAQYTYKRVLTERMEIVAEAEKMDKIARANGSASEWMSMAVGRLLERGTEVAGILHEALNSVLRGGRAELDFTYRSYPLEKSVVLRGMFTRGRRDGFGARYISALPGYIAGEGDASSVGSVEALVVRARAELATQDANETEAFFEASEQFEQDGADHYRSMGRDRDELVAKMADAYDVHAGSTAYRQSEFVESVAEPITTSVQPVSDPVAVINDEYRVNMPQLDDTDLAIRAHLASAGDQVESFYAAERRVNRDRGGLARDQRIRRSRIDTAGGGKRVMTQAETILCFNKRVNNAPRASAPRDYDQAIDRQLSRFVSVVMREDWKDIVAKRCSEGMWRNSLVEIGKTVNKATTKNVQSMLRESFSTAEIDMSSWSAIVKSVPKSKVSQSVAYEHPATQTIMFQRSKMTNAKHSSILSEVHDTLDEVVMPHININARRDFSDHERWFNSFAIRRHSVGDKLRSVELDVSQCDKSHILYNFLLYFGFLRLLGCPEEHVDLLAVMAGRKVATAEMAGMMIVFYEQLLSGAHLTISFNSIVCAIAAVDALELERNEVVTAQFTGDDSLLELNRSSDLQRTVDRMRDMNNLEAKVFEVDTPYFCSHYYVLWDGYYFMMRDPGKLVENMGRHISAVADVGELCVSYRDATRHYDKQEPLDALAVAFSVRAQWTTVPFAMLRGLSSLRDESLFSSVYGGEEVLVA